MRHSAHDACLVGLTRTSTKRATPSRRWIVGAVVLLAFVSAGSAAAQTPPGDLSGVDQYTEQLPTGGGNVPTGTGGGKTPPLRPSVKTDLRRFGGDDARLLETIATSPAFGAPRDGLSRSAARGDSKDGGRSKDGSRGADAGRADDRAGLPEGVGEMSFGDAVSSAAGALADGEGGGGPSPLMLALLAISAALAATAVWRARRHRA